MSDDKTPAPVEPPAEIATTGDDRAKEGSPFWSATGRAFAVTGSAIGRAAVATGRAAADAYYAVDPDLRRHLAQLPAMGLTMLTPRAQRVEPLPPDGHRPLILVHGLGGHPGNFMALRGYLRIKGHKRVYAADFGSAESLELMAELLKELVAAVVERNHLDPEDRVDLVAHSMGGLVSRLALEDPEFSRRVALLVTMGSPHAGTWMARLAVAGATPQLHPHSQAVQHLASQLPWIPDPDGPRLVALWSMADQLVSPPEGAQVPGAENIELEGFTHYSYFLEPPAWRLLKDLLDQG